MLGVLTFMGYLIHPLWEDHPIVVSAFLGLGLGFVSVVGYILFSIKLPIIKSIIHDLFSV